MAQDREQDHMDCKQPATSLLCANNCGFFGCPATMNLCSQCYKTLMLKEESKLAVKALGENQLTNLSENALSKEAIAAISSTMDVKGGDMVSTSSSSSLIAVSVSSDSVVCPIHIVDHTTKEQQGCIPLFQSVRPVVPQAPNTGSTRCLSCRKRVGLLGFKCRCGGVFCSSHRYSDTHACTYDYKAAGRDAIAKANPLVKAEKVEKI